ncbi:MAG TPA: DUF1549 domain-containing protein [Pirellulaceae bacterium]|nr:DUF1549 domain-containing protein [Pirellulaceae bacterium]
MSLTWLVASVAGEESETGNPVRPRSGGPHSVTFDRDVMGVLSKAGCNLGACHGNANGKGGFKLSLRGEDPAWDHAALTRDAAQRRVNVFEPEASLILAKPGGKLAHEGGVRFKGDSLEYGILRDWIAAGAKGPDSSLPALVGIEVTPREAIVADPQQEVLLRVTARFADGSERDVTPLAVYELTNAVAAVDAGGRVQREQYGQTTIIVRYLTAQVPVRLAFLPARPDFVWKSPQPANYIDEHVFARLKQLQINPAEVCDDATFVRRAFLDALGILPTADEARSFVADPSADKRARLIDELLRRPEFAEHWALKWSDVLRNEEKVLDATGVDKFHAWIKEWISEGRPLDHFARALVVGEGSTYENPAANFYRANRDPLTRGETAARLFLGVRLQCARCHNHPYDRWTQDDYYSWAAVFGRIDYQILENNRSDKLDKNEFTGEQIVFSLDEGEVKNARTGADAPPKFLGGDHGGLTSKDDRLAPLAEWLVSPENRPFARAQANFIFYHVLGRGLVEPIDDFRLTNPPSHPELLEALADDLITSRYDLRHLVRTIMNSRTYQLAAFGDDSRDDEASFARALVRRLPAETLLDAQCQVLEVSAKFAGYPEGTRAGQVRGVQRGERRSRGSSGDRFLKTFGKPMRLLACECERSNETTLKQAFVLIGDEGLNELLTSGDGRLAKLASAEMSDRDRASELYWSAVNRAPTEAELKAAEELLSSTADKLATLQDLAWALLNAKEFLFRH